MCAECVGVECVWVLSVRVYNHGVCVHLCVCIMHIIAAHKCILYTCTLLPPSHAFILHHPHHHLPTTLSSPLPTLSPLSPPPPPQGDIVREKKGDLVLALEGAQQQVTALKQNVEDSVTQAAQGVKDKGREAKRSVATGVVKLLDEEEVLAPPEPKHKRFWFF